MTKLVARWMLVFVLGLVCAGCAPQPSPRPAGQGGSIVEHIDEATQAATQFLIQCQSPPGVWRSDVYGTFKAGDALTPLVLLALSDAASRGVPPDEATTKALAAGRRYLAAQVSPDGVIAPQSLAYPTYAAALAVRVLAGQPEYATQRDAWLAFLRERQLNKALGWSPEDPQYGGWGYAADPPRKPAAGEPLAPLAEPNLSATVHALLALHSAGVEPNAPEFQAALQFVRRCQNFAPEGTSDELNDGGFFFTLDDPVRNKAGLAGEASEPARFASYGSTTCDGLLALLLAGEGADERRINEAWLWLERNFSVAQHPGHYAEDREAARESVYFYYCHALTEVLQQVRSRPELEEIDTGRLAGQLAAELLARQREDGSWINASVDVREDDPLVATALALRALSRCAQILGPLEREAPK